MTADHNEYQAHNLAFFREMILAPSEEPRDLFRGSPTAHSLGLIEAALWLRLGTELDFFERETVADLLTSIGYDLTTAWIKLLNSGLDLSVEWCDFMSPEPQMKVLESKFFNPPDRVYATSAEHLEHLGQCFLGCLLLTSEILFDRSTMFFLERIGWTTDEALNPFLKGAPIFPGFSVQDLYIGFENHVRYYAQLEHHLQNYLVLMTEKGDLESGGLQRTIETIVSRRRLLDREPGRTRCLRLGGEIVAAVYSPGPEWLEARKSILSPIMSVARISRNELGKYWSHFAGPSEAIGGSAGQMPVWLDDSTFA